MIELSDVFRILNSELAPTTEKLGFKAVIPTNLAKAEPPVFIRNDSQYIAYKGEKGSIRILFSENKIRLLAGDSEAKSEDDSDYTLTASFLLNLDEYDDRDVKSLANEIAENLMEAYTPKQIAKRQQNIKAQPTVSRSQVKSGAMLYDSATLAIKLAAMYPGIKDEYKKHLEKYDEFLCEDFFINHVNQNVYNTIVENNPQKMKKLFNILNEVFEDGSNEVQDVIVVTMLASFDYTPEMHENVLKYISDTMMEPFIRVNKILKNSKGARLRLENPPKYKPKKKKKKSRFASMSEALGNSGQ
ncbi:MAG: hypothetical protein LUH40_03320 [Clostridiales bacterium]|nr:hypothetical protein [Clostridiales bacterium]